MPALWRGCRLRLALLFLSSGLLVSGSSNASHAALETVGQAAPVAHATLCLASRFILFWVLVLLYNSQDCGMVLVLLIYYYYYVVC